MKAWAFFAVMLVALAAFCRCGSLNGGTNNRYVVSPLTDTLTIKLPGYENELCEVTVYGNNAHFYGTDYVMGGCVKFGVSSLPAEILQTVSYTILYKSASPQIPPSL